MPDEESDDTIDSATAFCNASGAVDIDGSPNVDRSSCFFNNGTPGCNVFTTAPDIDSLNATEFSVTVERTFSGFTTAPGFNAVVIESAIILFKSEGSDTVLSEESLEGCIDKSGTVSEGTDNAVVRPLIISSLSVELPSTAFSEPFTLTGLDNSPVTLSVNVLGKSEPTDVIS